MGNIRFIVDVHGKFSRYKTVIKDCPKSIQVGDMGVGFRSWPHGELSANPPFDAMSAGDHRFIRGNHDNPGACAKQRYWIADGAVEDGMMLIGGAVSIDKALRIEDYSWWPDEELSIGELNALVDKYIEVKPRIMVTHECPEEISRVILARYGLPGIELGDFPSRTRQAFQAMLSAHSPKEWIFGHYHVDLDIGAYGTHFICLAELSYRDLDISTPPNDNDPAEIAEAA